MTDYRNKFGKSERKVSLIDSIRREDLFDRNGNKIIQSISDSSYTSEAESERFVKAYIKQRSRYIPELDYSDPSTFCFYGSAERYYEDSIERIYNTYPYDGSKAEKMEWSLTASYLDLYMLEHEYPKAKGHVSFANGGWGTQAASQGVFGLSSNPEYIYFVGGPHSGTIFNSSKERENNLKIDGAKGNTAEFWLKKQSFVGSSLTTREVIFDSHTSGSITGTSKHGRFTVMLDSSVGSGSPFKLTYLSGTAGITDQVLGTNAVTKTTVADNAWHHYAITVIHSGSNVISKLYVDGTLEDTNTVSVSSFGAVDRNFVGTIGALATGSSGGTGAKIGYGKLSGSLDEFRFWKEARTEKQIGRYWYRPVHGGTDSDNNNPNLGLYYKFNEGITGIQVHDEVVLDYSGRISNGKFVGWSSQVRSNNSGIELSNNLPESTYTEPGDPIINKHNSLVQNTLTKYKDFGKSHDLQNGSSLVNTVPSYFLDEDDTGLMAELMQIMSSTLDDLFLKVKFLPKIKDYSYSDFFEKKGVHQSTNSNDFTLGCEDSTDYKFTGHHSKPWVNHILEHFGLITTEIFPDASLFETFMQQSEKVTFEQNLHEVKNAILSNIHSSLINIYNTKGTEKSFRNLIRCFGVDDELIKLNVYGNNEEYKLESKPIYTTARQKSVNFSGTNYQGTIFQTASNNSSLEKRYFTSSADPKPLTIEANIIFPDQESLNSNFLTSSLFGMHSVFGASGSSDALTWHASDHASVQAYFVRRGPNTAGGYFLLTSSAGIFNEVKSDYFPEVYNSGHWNVSARVAKKADIDFALTKLSGSSGYRVEFAGYNYDLDVLRNSFYVTSDITRAEFENFSKLDRAVYAGSHKTNFTGSHLHSSDIRLLGMSVWLDGLADEELKEHAQNPTIYGRTDPQHVSNFDDGSNLRAGDSALLRWRFDNNLSSSYNSASSKAATGTITTTSATLSSYNNNRIIITNAAGTAKTFLFDTTNGEGSTGTVDGSGNIVVQLHSLGSVGLIAAQLANAINGVSGFNITVTQGTGENNDTLSLVQGTAGTAGNVAIQNPDNIMGLTVSGLSGGAAAISEYTLDVTDHSSGSLETVSKNLVGYRYPGKATGLPGTGSAIVQEFLPVVQYAPVDNVYSSDRVKVKTTEIEKFTADSRPVTYFYSFEKSMYQVISKEMINMFAGIVGISNLIGEPVNKYRENYKLMDKMREKFFRNVENDIDYDRFVQYYRWIDSSLSHFLEQLIPASSNFAGRIRDVVESHILERNKYKYQAPTMEYKDPTVKPHSILGVNELLYDWKHGHAPISGDANENCLWQKDRSERAAPADRETIRRTKNINVSGSTYVMRKLSRPYRFGVSHQRPLGTGFNRKTNKNPELYKMATRADKIELSASNITENPACKDIINPNLKEHYRGSTNVINNENYLDADSDLLFPFTMISSSAGRDLQQVKEKLQIANNHLDIGIHGEQSLQSPFTRQHVGGMSHRKVEIGLTGSTVRPEAYNLTASDATMILTTAAVDRPKSMFYRDMGLGTAYMFKNVKHGTGSNILGNYNKDYEIVLTNGRLQNNTAFVDQGGFTFSPAPSTWLTGVVDVPKPTRPKNSHVIVNHFNAPGGPETMSPFGMDRESEEYSIYSTINYRNSVVRDVLNALSSEHSEVHGYRSGSSTQASIHMTNRNATRRTGSTGEEYDYDNLFIQRPIPQTDYQYSWVTASAADSVYKFLARNDNFGYVHNFKLANSKYKRSFAKETSGSVPTDFLTNQSQRTADYVDIERVQTVQESPANESFRFGNQVSISGDVLVVTNNRHSFFSNESTVYIFRSSSTGYQQEHADVAISSSARGVINSITNHGDFVACNITGSNGAGTNVDHINIYKHGGSGNWTKVETISGSTNIGGGNFRKICRMELTASAGGVYSLVTLNSGSIKIFERSSDSNWTTKTTTITSTHSGSQNYEDVGYLNIRGDMKTTNSRIIVGNSNGFSVLKSGSSAWGIEDYITPADWGWKPINHNNYGVNSLFGAANYRNNTAFHSGTFALITQTDDSQLSDPPAGAGSYISPEIQIYKYSSGAWSLYQKLEPVFSDHAEKSNTRVLSVALSDGLMFVGVTESDLYFDDTLPSEEGERDYGSVIVFADNGTQYVEQRKLFSASPARNAGMGSSMVTDGTRLAVGSPSLSVLANYNYQEMTDSTTATVFKFAKTAAQDKSLKGPRIVGPADARAFGSVGSGSFFNEVSQVPSSLENSIGKKLRVIEHAAPIKQKISQFCVELDVIAGTTDATKLANSSYGLKSPPSGFFLVQYKLDSGVWKDTSIRVSLASSDAFSRVKSKAIDNYENKRISIRILTVTDGGDRSEWAFKNLNVVPSSDAYNSSAQLLKSTSFRSSPVRKLHNNFSTLYFNGATQHLTGNLSSNSTAYFVSGARNDNTFSTQVWVKPEIDFRGERMLFHNPQNYILAVSSSADYPDYLDIRFHCFSGTQTNFANGKYLAPQSLSTYGGSIGKVLKQKIRNREWQHIVTSYDASKDANGINIYINGQLQVSASLLTYGTYTGMAGYSDTIVDSNHINFGYHAEDRQSGEKIHHFQGYMSNFALWGSELSRSDVKLLYNLKNNVNDHNIQLGDPLAFRTSALFDQSRSWVPFTTLNSGSNKVPSAANPHLFTDLKGAMNYLSSRPDLRPKMKNTLWDVANTAETFTLDAAQNLISESSVTGSYLQNTLSAYSWPTWKQIRGSENPITIKQRKENIISLVVRGSETMPSVIDFYEFDLNKNLQSLSTSKMTQDRSIINYSETMITGRHNPITITLHNESAGGLSIDRLAMMHDINTMSQKNEELLWNFRESTFTAIAGIGNPSAEDLLTPRPDRRLLIARKTYANDLSSFANEELTDKLKINDFRNHSFLDLLLDFQEEFGADQGTTVEISYIETLYPREKNTYTKNARSREKFRFFGWPGGRENRTIILSGSNVYNSSLVSGDGVNLFPKITVDKFDYQRTNPFFADVVDSNSADNPTSFNHIRQSSWPLDAREDFAASPLSITSSFFNEGKDFLIDRIQGLRGEGVLQNDYSIFGLGLNTVHGTPPPAPLYSRRIPQKYGTNVLLSGEAKWEATGSTNTQPFKGTYEDYREKMRSLAQDHSLVPEFRISEFLEDTIKNNNADFLDSDSISKEFLSLTGAIYNQSSGDLSIGSTFFKTYGTSEFMKYFNPILEKTELENMSNDLDPLKLTLKCQAALKFIPYTGFYPAERTVQIAELFARAYMSDFTFTNTFADPQVNQTDAGVRNLLERKIRANLQQSIKPFMAPGILYNSIKSGLAVDYPLFGSATDETAIGNFQTAIDSQSALTGGFGAALGAMTMFTGSAVNQSTNLTGAVSPGIPRLSGSTYRRVTFEELLEPEKLKGVNILDNEPHPSASIYYGNSALARIMDYPNKFGEIDISRTKKKLNADNFSIKKPLSETMVPYKMAINNFCAETINFFLEDSSTATLESEPVNPYLKAQTEYVMRVYLKNKALKMYDRHSSFGPPVDEGRGLTKTVLKEQTITVHGSGARATLGTPQYMWKNPTVTDLGNASKVENKSMPGLVLTSSAGATVAIKFVTGAVAGCTNISAKVRTEKTPYGKDVTNLGNIYLKGTSSYIDLASIESNYPDPYNVYYARHPKYYYDSNRSSALATLITMAIEAQNHLSGAGIRAACKNLEITDRDLWPPSAMSSQARKYWRKQVEVYQEGSKATFTFSGVPIDGSTITLSDHNKIVKTFEVRDDGASASGDNIAIDPSTLGGGAKGAAKTLANAINAQGATGVSTPALAIWASASDSGRVYLSQAYRGGKGNSTITVNNSTNWNNACSVNVPSAFTKTNDSSTGQTWRHIKENHFGNANSQANERVTHYFEDLPASASFSGGSEDSTVTKFVDAGNITVQDDHGFAPYHPPFLDPNSEPYVEISFTPPANGSGNYTLDQILDGATYTYNNFVSTPSNASTSVTRKNNSNFANAMSISASIDLSAFVQYEEEESDVGADREERKRWVIQTKWETPVLQFANVTSSALRLDTGVVESVTGSPWQMRTWERYYTKSLSTSRDYLTGSVGMWHQHGEVPDLIGEGYELSVEEVEGVPPSRQLSRKVGFTKSQEKSVSANPGLISTKKEISEAVVAIPYYVEDGCHVRFFDLDKDIVDQAQVKNEDLRKRLLNKEISEQQYKKLFNTPGQHPALLAAYQMRMMEKFIMPPQFDFVRNPELQDKNRPMMYVFQFNAAMTRNDLKNIWQNVAPSSALSTGKLRYSGIDVNTEIHGISEDIQYVTHFLDLEKMPFETEDREDFLKKKVRWIVFKAKMRAEKDLAKIKRGSLPGNKAGKKIVRTSLRDSGYFYKDNTTEPSVNESRGIEGLKYKYSFNWPYDYFSIVELIKLEGKVDFLPKVPEQRS